MAKPDRAGRDDRPRFYIRQTMDGGFAWRRGVSGLDGRTQTPGAALDMALADIAYAPAVIIWEGRHDAE